MKEFNFDANGDCNFKCNGYDYNKLAFIFEKHQTQIFYVNPHHDCKLECKQTRIILGESDIKIIVSGQYTFDFKTYWHTILDVYKEYLNAISFLELELKNNKDIFWLYEKLKKEMKGGNEDE